MLIQEIFEYRQLRGIRDLQQQALDAADAARLTELKGKFEEAEPGRRRYRRVAAQMQAGILANDNWAITRVLDFGAGGCSAANCSGMTRGQIVKLRVGEAGDNFEFTGQVVWVTDAKVGVAFLGIPQRVQDSPKKRATPRILRRRDGTAKREHREPHRFSVRYGAATEFVREYAENLSCGGVFIGGAQDLPVGSAVEVSLSLPGLGVVPVVAEVVHTISKAQAQTLGRSPGAGLAIVDGPDNLGTLLADYLRRLGRRRDWRVLCAVGPLLQQFVDAGFRVEGIEKAEDLPDKIFARREPLAGLVVAADEQSTYRDILSRVMADGLVHVGDEDDCDSIVAKIDDYIAFISTQKRNLA